MAVLAGTDTALVSFTMLSLFPVRVFVLTKSDI